MKLISDITVRLIDHSPDGDQRVIGAMKVMEAVPPPDPGDEGRIRFLVRHRHSTPFQHSILTFFVRAPAFVWWEWVRHRIGQTVDCDELSFNLESGRYSELQPEFWVPRRERPMAKASDFKPGKPKLERLEGDYAYGALLHGFRSVYRHAWAVYQNTLAAGIAPEVARAVLGFGVYYSGWVTCNPTSLMHFLSLRTHEPTAAFVSWPQAEIEEAARACEAVFAAGWPLTWKAFNEFGRTAS